MADMEKEILKKPRLIAAPLPGNRELHVAAGLCCPCGAPARPHPKANGAGFELLCDSHHVVAALYECVP
jgi:hypothetical protein